MARPTKKDSAANLGFEAKLWLAADKLRSNMDAAEYKHVSTRLGQDKSVRGKRRFGLVNRARRVRLMGDQPKQSNATTRRLVRQSDGLVPWRAVMNLALRGIEADFGPEHADTFRRDLHPDLRADYVLANPPFNDSDWFRKDDDVRWQWSEATWTTNGSPKGEHDQAHQFGSLSRGNANFAWPRKHSGFIHHLASQGMAGFVLANGSMSSNQSGDCNARSARLTTTAANLQSLGRQGDIRRALIEADLVDCMVALPGQLFYSTQIPVCLWFISRDKSGGKPSPGAARPPLPLGEGRGEGKQQRDRRGETLFIDARKMGTLIDRVHRELTEADHEKIVNTYHAWRSAPSLNSRPSTRNSSAYADVSGFCKSASTDVITKHGYVLTPGRYVDAEEAEDDGEPFDEKMPRLVAELEAQFSASAKLESAIRANLAKVVPCR
jgi:type I restriction enzyme M protein